MFLLVVVCIFALDHLGLVSSLSAASWSGIWLHDAGHGFGTPGSRSCHVFVREVFLASVLRPTALSRAQHFAHLAARRIVFQRSALDFFGSGKLPRFFPCAAGTRGLRVFQACAPGNRTEALGAPQQQLRVFGDTLLSAGWRMVEGSLFRGKVARLCLFGFIQNDRWFACMTSLTCVSP